jgi:hypothetical protein
VKAKQEYAKWCALERMNEESRFGTMQEKAYVAGFKRAIELVEDILKRQGESHESIDA